MSLLHCRYIHTYIRFIRGTSICANEKVCEQMMCRGVVILNSYSVLGNPSGEPENHGCNEIEQDYKRFMGVPCFRYFHWEHAILNYTQQQCKAQQIYKHCFLHGSSCSNINSNNITRNECEYCKRLQFFWLNLSKWVVYYLQCFATKSGTHFRLISSSLCSNIKANLATPDTCATTTIYTYSCICWCCCNDTKNI